MSRLQAEDGKAKKSKYYMYQRAVLLLVLVVLVLVLCVFSLRYLWRPSLGKVRLNAALLLHRSSNGHCLQVNVTFMITESHRHMYVNIKRSGRDNKQKIHIQKMRTKKLNVCGLHGRQLYFSFVSKLAVS